MKVILPIFTLVLAALLGYFLRPTVEAPKIPHEVLRPAVVERKISHEKVTLAGLSSVTGNEFPFSTVIEKTCGVKILKSTPSHTPLLAAIEKAGLKVSEIMSRPDSPAREKRRINEVSALFEDALRIELDFHPDFSCDFPKTKDGEAQRSGYPDLRLKHLPTGTIAYLDPKLFEAKSIKSSFRTFYYEPSEKRSKVTEDALHLLIGFPHDGKTRAWTFAKPHLVDLSNLTVTLKTEFSASNKDVYGR
jgi:hypothetical protein